MPLSIRILKYESAFEQRFGIVERHALQIRVALWIDKDHNAIILKDLVHWPRAGFQLELIAHTGASSTHDAEAQATFTMILLEKCVNSRNRFRRDLNRWIFHKKALLCHSLTVAVLLRHFYFT